MASQTQGIQQLLAAEKRAAEKVTEARKRKWTGQVIQLFVEGIYPRDVSHIYRATLIN